MTKGRCSKNYGQHHTCFLEPCQKRISTLTKTREVLKASCTNKCAHICLSTFAHGLQIRNLMLIFFLYTVTLHCLKIITIIIRQKPKTLNRPKKKKKKLAQAHHTQRLTQGIVRYNLINLVQLLLHRHEANVLQSKLSH